MTKTNKTFRITKRLRIELSINYLSYKSFVQQVDDKALYSFYSPLTKVCISGTEQSPTSQLIHEYNLSGIKELFDLDYEIIKDQIMISFNNYLKQYILNSVLHLGLSGSRLHCLRHLLSSDIIECYSSRYSSGQRAIKGLIDLASNSEILLYLTTKYIRRHRKDTFFRFCKSKNQLQNYAGSFDNIRKGINYVQFKREYRRNYLLAYLCHLVLQESLDLFLIYEPTKPLQPFVVKDFLAKDEILYEGCTIIGLSNIINQALDMENVDELTKELLDRQYQRAWKRNSFFDSVQESLNRLDNFKLKLSVQSKHPTYGEIAFVHQKLHKFESLKKYVGKYGFVVPVHGTLNKRVLKGQKLLKLKGGTSQKAK